jgi:hypothetical protein
MKATTGFNGLCGCSGADASILEDCQLDVAESAKWSFGSSGSFKFKLVVSDPRLYYIMTTDSASIIIMIAEP